MEVFLPGPDRITTTISLILPTYLGSYQFSRVISLLTIRRLRTSLPEEKQDFRLRNARSQDTLGTY